MSELGVVAFGGSTHVTSAESSAIDEIWECTFALEVDDGFGFTTGFSDAIGALVTTWFQAGDSRINNTEYLEYVKVNQYDLVTGHQLTDPTIESVYTGVNGSDDGSNPVSTSYRLSLDDSTRNPRHKGGFFAPRCGAPVQSNGRWSESVVTGMVDSATIMFNGINAISGVVLAIWSRADHATHVVNRLRIGDVPDNISRRRNRLRENYLGTGL